MRYLCVAALSVALITTATADVTVKQGVPDKRRLTSPMIVEMPFPTSSSATWGKGPTRTKDTASLRQLICDGISIVDFTVTTKSRRDGHLRHYFTFLLVNEPGVDKRAHVKLELLRGDTVIAITGQADIEVEEGRMGNGHAEFLTKKDIQDMPHTLRLTLTVRDDA